MPNIETSHGGSTHAPYIWTKEKTLCLRAVDFITPRAQSIFALNLMALTGAAAAYSYLAHPGQSTAVLAAGVAVRVAGSFFMLAGDTSMAAFVEKEESRWWASRALYAMHKAAKHVTDRTDRYIRGHWLPTKYSTGFWLFAASSTSYIYDGVMRIPGPAASVDFLEPLFLTAIGLATTVGSALLATSGHMTVDTPAEIAVRTAGRRTLMAPAAFNSLNACVSGNAGVILMALVTVSNVFLRQYIMPLGAERRKASLNTPAPSAAQPG